MTTVADQGPLDTAVGGQWPWWAIALVIGALVVLAGVLFLRGRVHAARAEAYAAEAATGEV